jgi:hypothetical protein
MWSAVGVGAGELRIGLLSQWCEWVEVAERLAVVFTFVELRAWDGWLIVRCGT